MALRKEPSKSEIKNWLAFYNMVPNLFWSILNLVPVSVYCFNHVEQKNLYLFLAVSLFPLLVKRSFLDKIQISKSAANYQKLGVPVVNRFAQNGAIINNLMKRKFPGYRSVTSRKSSIAALINQTYVFEKFHWILFIFFFLIIIYAILNRQVVWACVIFVNNTLYNFYPNLLQQYIRLKLRLSLQKNQ